MMLSTVSVFPAASFAQGHDHAGMQNIATTPGSAWLSIEENLRNLTDALRVDDLASVPAFSGAMSTGIGVLQSSDIHNEVKPHEVEHLMKSLDELKAAIDGLAAVAESNDKAAIEAALTQVSGAVTLTRIDVPPGLLEKISGAGVRAEIVNTPVLQKGVAETVTLRLKSAITGKPLKSEDLATVHEKIVHALVIDPQMVDYTHAHPQEIDVPGEYTFTITPQTDCTYRVWADVTPVGGKQEFAMVDMPGKDGCGSRPVDQTEVLTGAVEGYTMSLKLPEGGLLKGKEGALEFEITNAAGEAVTGLEPLLGAYAHVVGFYDDYRTIAHLHPLGAEPKADSDRGSAPLPFHFKPEHAGFVKLFMQISVEGKTYTVPFGVTVAE